MRRVWCGRAQCARSGYFPGSPASAGAGRRAAVGLIAAGAALALTCGALPAQASTPPPVPASSAPVAAAPTAAQPFRVRGDQPAHGRGGVPIQGFASFAGKPLVGARSPRTASVPLPTSTSPSRALLPPSGTATSSTVVSLSSPWPLHLACSTTPTGIVRLLERMPPPNPHELSGPVEWSRRAFQESHHSLTLKSRLIVVSLWPGFFGTNQESSGYFRFVVASSLRTPCSLAYIS